MLRTDEGESEILLGNKQLLGIFFAVALLLGIAFAGGYAVGRGSRTKSSVMATGSTESASAQPGETHALPGEPPANGKASPAAGSNVSPDQTNAASESSPALPDDGALLGSHKSKSTRAKSATETTTAATPRMAASAVDYTPQSGQTFLQVAAVSRDEAAAVADVLAKKGFRAHAVPKPGNPKVYRILIGPIRDTGDLSSTRDQLRKTGFREVIVQRY